MFSRRPGRRGLLLASAVFACFAQSAAVQAQELAVPVAQIPDPAMQNLAIPDGADVHGMWSGVQGWPLIGIHSALLPNGKVVTYGSPNGQGVQSGRVYDIWDPARGFGGGSHITLTGVADVDSFCSAAVFLNDGSTLISGGIFANGNDKGSVVVNSTGSALRGLGRNMAYDRYYATMLTQSDGRALIVGGSYPYTDVNNFVPEVYDEATGWRSVFGGADGVAFSRAEGRFWYPRAWQGPTGRVFGISTEQMWWMDTQGNGGFQRAGILKGVHTYDRTANRLLPNVGPTSTAVMYDVGRIIQMGGNGQGNGDGTYSSSAATIVDINGATPVLREAAPMIFGRQWGNAVALPTGTVMVNGGSLWADEADWSDVRPVELWDKGTNAWTLGASAGVYRGYHSSALLLPNGTVLTAGGGVPGPVVNLNAEIYYPPYLFQRIDGRMQLAPRPQVVSLDTTKLTHGQSIRVEMANANPVRSAALVRVGQDTHSFDSGQRYVPVTFTQAGRMLTMQAPGSAAVAPPGYYMLAVVNADGVPSPSVMLALGAAIAAPPSAPATLVGAVSSAANAAVTGGGVTVTGPSYEWRNCAGEGGTCNGPANSTFRYGVGDRWLTRTMRASLLCSAAAFGDPAPGQAKSCQILASLNPAVTRAPGTVPTQTPTPGPTPTPPASNLPSGTWTQCAVEGQTCNVPAGTTLRYGANSRYVVRTVTGATFCDNAVFGDPLEGTNKTCDRLTPPVTPSPTPTPTPTPGGGSWVECAKESETCTVAAGTIVRYGIKGIYATRTAGGPIGCNNETFGDPVVGTVKACDRFVAAGTAPVPTPAGILAASAWNACAREGEQCIAPAGSTIRYGADSRYAVQINVGTLNCGNGTFGDPVVGPVKTCDVAPPTKWVDCAAEGGQCVLPSGAMIRYGTGARYVTTVAAGTTACVNGVFGDPAEGAAKVCQRLEATGY